MSQGLNVNRVVNVTVSLTPTPAGYRNFGSMLCLGSTPGIIDTVERKRDYADVEGVAADFGTTAPEYLFAQEFFSQDPQPSILSVGRWAQTPTHGHLRGATLTPAQRLITNFNTINNASLRISVDGVPYTLTGLNLTAQTNLNGVASVIQAALVTAGATGATVLWNGVYNRFEVTSGSTGVTSLLSYATPATAATSVAFSAQPAPNSTLTLNGSALTFVSASPTTGQVLIGATLAATLTNAAAAINPSTDPQISKFTAVSGPSTLYLYADAVGTGGNALTVVASSSPASNATVSASPMTGGGGADISVLTGLSVTPTGVGLANADPPVAGIAAETALAAVETLGDMFGDWYCLGVAPVTPLADSDAVAVSGYIEAAGQSRIAAYTTQNTAALDPTRSDDLGSLLMAAGYSRSFVEFSSTNPYAVASLFARFATVNYNGSATTITGKFKQQPGVIAEFLTETQAETLANKNYNVYAAYQNGTAITQEAVMANGNFIDSRINADWLANYVQTNVFNLFLTSATKNPQTDEGMAIVGNIVSKSLQQAVTNGYLAPGQWNGDPLGATFKDGSQTLNTGDFLPLGYLVYIPPVASQPETLRAKRIAVPIQVAAKEAGAIHSCSISILVNP